MPVLSVTDPALGDIILEKQRSWILPLSGKYWRQKSLKDLGEGQHALSHSYDASKIIKNTWDFVMQLGFKVTLKKLPPFSQTREKSWQINSRFSNWNPVESHVTWHSWRESEKGDVCWNNQRCLSIHGHTLLQLGFHGPPFVEHADCQRSSLAGWSGLGSRVPRGQDLWKRVGGAIKCTSFRVKRPWILKGW